jgi:hypothetical protein
VLLFRHHHRSRSNKNLNPRCHTLFAFLVIRTF